MKELDKKASKRISLYCEAQDICDRIYMMTDEWKDSGLSWNTDIMSKFYVMSLLAKDVYGYLEEETDKDLEDEPSEEELHERRIDGIIEALIQGVENCDGIADVEIYKKAHDDVTDEEIEEALDILDNSPNYAVYRPTITTMCEYVMVNKEQFTLATRNDINFRDAVNYILKRRGLKNEE